MRYSANSMSAVLEAAGFESHLGREILQSERLRMAILAGLFGVVMAMIALFAWIFREGPAPFLRSPHTLALAFVVNGGLIAYELLVRFAVGRLLRRGVMPPPALRFVNAAVETSVPSLLIMLAAREVDPVAVLQGPGAYLYALFIILSTLRLDFKLSAFTGVVAAVEFAALSFAHAAAADSDVAAMLSAPPVILAKALLLFLSGVVAGLVGKQLRLRITRTFQALQERERAISAFGQQVSPQVADQLLRQGSEMASRRSFVCVMFMDIRDFTPLVETRSPEEIVALQNAVFGTAIDVVNRHHGVINQFLGDGFMATFGAPLSTGEDCRNALAAARELVAKIEEVRIGIGLHAGDAVSGNIGSEARKQYSITGNVVILASRIEQLNKEFGSRLLVSREVFERGGDQGAGAAPLGPVHVKGRAEAIEIYRLA
jgi:adenylate cyclase